VSQAINNTEVVYHIARLVMFMCRAESPIVAVENSILLSVLKSASPYQKESAAYTLETLPAAYSQHFGLASQEPPC
jgi:hypothetical protein